MNFKLPYETCEFIGSRVATSRTSTTAILKRDFGDFYFQISGNIATSIIEGGGYKVKNNCNEMLSLENVISDLGAANIHFPLVYESYKSFKFLCAHSGIAQLERRPTCVIDYPVPEGGLFNRARDRLGNRAIRRVNNFQNRGGSVLSLIGAQAVDALLNIEINSWKFQAKQDMLSRNQFEFYSRLVHTNAVSLRVAFVARVPIAYRMEVKLDSILYILKWSFDERYRALSPGFYLLTKDIDDCYHGSGIRLIDLYGSPDALKDAISTRHIRRFDFYWPPGQSSIELLGERAAHDQMNIQEARHGNGIKTAYGV